MARSPLAGATIVGLLVMLALTTGCVQARTYKHVDASTGVVPSEDSNNSSIPSRDIVANELLKFVKALNTEVNDRFKVTCLIANHLKEAFPSVNIVAVHGDFQQSVGDSVSVSTEVRTGPSSYTNYEVYVFKKGTFTVPTSGDLFYSYCYLGNCLQQDYTVTCSDP